MFMVKVLKATSVVVPLLVMAMLLMACSASQHAGRTTVSRPSLSESSDAAWFKYWQDQLDAYQGNVMTPTSDYPYIAQQAFQAAVQDWNGKVSSASTKTYLLGAAAGAVIIGASLLIFTVKSPSGEIP